MTHPDELAFPSLETETNLASIGLSIREYFAAKAMQGLLAKPGETRLEADEFWCRHDLASCAKQAVLAADFLILALNRPSVEESREAERVND